MKQLLLLLIPIIFASCQKEDGYTKTVFTISEQTEAYTKYKLPKVFINGVEIKNVQWSNTHPQSSRQPTTTWIEQQAGAVEYRFIWDTYTRYGVVMLKINERKDVTL